MRYFLFFVLCPVFVFCQGPDSLIIRKIYDEALIQGNSYENLRYLTKKIGHRLTCSPAAAAAVEFTRQVMSRNDFDTVYLQEVKVPCWTRGDLELGRILSTSGSGQIDVRLTALGNSVGTPPQGITSEVLEVHSFEELKELGAERIKGNIIFFNRPMDPTEISTFSAYGGAVNQRSKGAVEAAKYGAVAVIVRSMTLANDDHPHTGAVSYEDSVIKIPAAALSTKSADFLSNILLNEKNVRFYLNLNCEYYPDEISYNVIGEMKGSESPEEIITVGGHLDSWDIGEGAHDDGAGCIQSIECVRILKEISYRPKKTLRVVMFMNEENGLRGGKVYADNAALKNEKHFAAIESDAGGFVPRGFSFSTGQDTLKKFQSWLGLLSPYGIHDFTLGGGGADISYLKNQNCLLIGLRPDSQRYFDYHHAETDVFEAINKRELELGAAAMAALIYLLDTYEIP